LSNTIIALVSLIPDIFRPDNAANTVLEHCSGFFDSIDLVNSELGRKGKARNRPAQTANNTSNKGKKNEPGKTRRSEKKKKRILSFSNVSSGAGGGSSSRSAKSMVDVSGKLDSSVVKGELAESPLTSTPSGKKNDREKVSIKV